MNIFLHGNKKTNPVKINLILFLLTFFYSTLLIFPQRNFYFIIPIIFVLLGPFSFLFQKEKFILDLKEIKILLILFCYTLLSIFITLYHGDNLSVLKDELIPLILIPAYFIFKKNKLSLKEISVIFIISSFVIFFIALYDKFHLGLERVFEFRQPIIPAGGIAMIFSLISLYLGIFFLSTQEKKYSLLCFLAFILALVTSIFTGSRGAWLCFPFVSIWIIFVFRKFLPIRFLLSIFCFLILLAIMTYFIKSTGIQHRIEQIIIDLTWYFKDKNPDSSIGLRFELWKSALDGWLQKPIIGWGEEQYKILKMNQIKQGFIIPQTLDFTHAHNQFFDTLVKKGLVGFLGLMLLLMYPLKVFYTIQKKSFGFTESKVISHLGIIVTIAVISFCCSDLFLGLQIGMIFYVTTLIFLSSLLFKYHFYD